MKRFIIYILCLSVFFIAKLSAQSTSSIDKFYQAVGSPVNPKVKASWNHYRNLDQIESLCKEIAQAHPTLAKCYTIGKSYEGNDIYGLTITDFSHGDADRKPAILIYANIHSNEIQGTATSLYTAWYLTEMFESTPYIKELLKDKTFYIIPTINPDARENFMYAPNTASSPRAGMIPIDSDRDGYVDEDGFDDLDGDGNIVQMRRKSKYGRYVADKNDTRRMVAASLEQSGEYEILGYEGYDSDGDGRVNEDGIGGYDPNRDFGYGWEPNFIQRGAYKYPHSIIENRHLVNFALSHPNIATGQTYHNTGGMILAPPGSVDDVNSVNRNDRKIYEYIASRGEELIPGYRSMIVYKDLYTTVGGDIDFFGLGLGIFMYCNEQWSTFDMFNGKYKGSDPYAQRYDFDKYLLFNTGVIDWKKVEHPHLGEIEIGGTTKDFGRNHPGFLLESSAHRNMAFTLFYCYNTPKLDIVSVKERNLTGGLIEVEATIENSRIMPTHTDWDLKNKITRPNWIIIEGADPIAGMIVTDNILGTSKEQERHPERLLVDNIPGNSTVTVKWIIKRSSKYNITVDSSKGGVVKYDTNKQ